MATTTAIIVAEDAEKLAGPIVSNVVTRAEALTIETTDDYEMGCMFLQFIASSKKEVEAMFKGDEGIVTKTHEAHKGALALFNRFYAPLLSAETIAKKKVVIYNTEQERLRRIREQEESERLRREAEAKAITEAEQLEAAGEKELADVVLQEAAAAPPPTAVVQSTVPKTSGISMREEWDFRIIDETKIPREFLMVNEKAIRAVVKAQKSLAKIPGVHAFKRPNIAVKAS